MSLTYLFQLAVPLANDTAKTLSNDLQRIVAENGTPNTLPEDLDLDPVQLSDWLCRSHSAGELRLVETPEGMQLTWWGQLPSDRFYTDFLPLLEWLAEAGGARGFVGTFHTRSLPHPTAIYFANGHPYSLQTMGDPTPMADGEPLDAEASVADVFCDAATSEESHDDEGADDDK